MNRPTAEVPDQIIVATDFSPAAAAACSIAAKMALLFQCKVLIVHVFQYVARHRYIMPVEWMTNTIRMDVERKLLEAQMVITDAGVEAQTLLIEDGDPVTEIVKTAETHRAPVIVMGTHAIAGMDRFLLGSSAEGVLREASCPVITVGPHVQVGEEADRFGRLLFATDFTAESLHAIPLLRMLRDSASSTLKVLHVEMNLDAAKTRETGLFDSLRADLDVSDMPHHHLETEYLTLHGGAVAQAISNEAEMLKADLLVLGVRRGTAFTTHLGPKIAFQVIAAAPCAVLTLSS